jgi:hypothetical protein
MPREAKPEGKQDLVAGPKEPHLGLMFKDQTMVPIPKGALLMLVHEFKDGEPTERGVQPLALVSVGLRKMVMKCPCGHPKCTRSVTWIAKWDGWHPPSAQK